MLYDLIDSEGAILKQAFKLRPTTPLLLEGEQWVPTGYVPPPSTAPEVVSRFQGRAALLQAGYLEDVDTYMLTADPIEQEAWASITEIRRHSPMTIRIGALLGITSIQTDDLFKFATTIVA